MSRSPSTQSTIKYNNFFKKSPGYLHRPPGPKTQQKNANNYGQLLSGTTILNITTFPPKTILAIFTDSQDQ
jgi:hypothetical protein